MDKVDREILAGLLQDARTPFKRMAETLGVSVDTISKRYSRMREEHVIRYATLILDLGKTGQGVSAWLSLTVEQGKPSEIEEKIKNKREVFLLGRTFGISDFVLLVSVRDLGHLEVLKDEITSIQGVKSCEVAILTSGITLLPMHQLPNP